MPTRAARAPSQPACQLGMLRKLTLKGNPSLPSLLNSITAAAAAAEPAGEAAAEAAAAGPSAAPPSRGCPPTLMHMRGGPSKGSQPNRCCRNLAAGAEHGRGDRGQVGEEWCEAAVAWSGWERERRALTAVVSRKWAGKREPAAAAAASAKASRLMLRIFFKMETFTRRLQGCVLAAGRGWLGGSASGGGASPPGSSAISRGGASRCSVAAKKSGPAICCS